MWPDGCRPARRSWSRQAAEAEGLLTLLTDAVDAELIDASPGLRAIANYAVGVDNVDLGGGHRARHPGGQHARTCSPRPPPTWRWR